VPLFRQVLDKDYTKEDYVRQFTIRVPENLAKIDRVEQFHRQNVPGAPQILYDVFDDIRKRLHAARDKHGDYISPFDLVAP
jgi:phosphoenolpyruvate carboxykinase (GTP)